jgi:alanyl-tRNA synthetase
MEYEKRIKEEFRKKAQKEPEKYYPVSVLREKGFQRFKCEKCGNWFWSIEERKVCGDPNCVGKYEFIGNSIIPKLDFVEVWKKFSKFFEKLGYTAVKRYPVVARWRDDIFFVEASIDDFIPYVVNGEVEAPANPLVVPQFCLRFNDIDNVGVTGRHYTGFVMIGQHAFVEKEKYDPEAYLEHIYLWLTEGLKIPKEKIQFHEDAWAGSGKLGPSLEYFSLGLELGNQVYMQYDIRNGIKDLPIKVLDMGAGQERYAWFSHATETSYEAVFPTVVKKLLNETGLKPSQAWKKFLPYCGLLNLDEVVDMEKAWREVAQKIGIDVKVLKKEILPLSALFAIAEHTRTLLFALSDGCLPSNVGGGYNLRIILRRCFNFIEKFGWGIELESLIREHAKYLKLQYPELSENLDEIAEIVAIERKRYNESKSKAKKLLEKLRKEEITIDKMVELYDSHGIHPEILKEKFGVEVPDNFYKLVTERHVSKREEKKEERIDVSEIKETRLLYYEDDKLYEFEAKILRIDGNRVFLDRTAFYPRGGGQECDFGFIGDSRVVNVEKIGNVVMHVVDKPSFEEGEIVRCKVDKERRERIRRHHSAVHLLNAACRIVLGNHVWQAGSYKDDKKARLDITHWENLTQEQINKIENLCNEFIAKGLKIEKFILPRNEAEAEYGFRLYQGGAVPGKEIRIVKIDEIDVEACGGLHVNNTKEIEHIVITRTEKIQDGVIRIEIVAGEAAKEYLKEKCEVLQKIAEELGVEENKVIETLENLLKKREELRARMKRAKKLEIEEVIKKLRFEEVNGKLLLVEKLSMGLEELKEISRKLSKDNTVIFLFGEDEEIWIFASKGEKIDINIGEFVKKVCEKLGGKGGGNENLGQGFGVEKEAIDEIIKWLKEMVVCELRK